MKLQAGIALLLPFILMGCGGGIRDVSGVVPPGPLDSEQASPAEITKANARSVGVSSGAGTSSAPTLLEPSNAAQVQQGGRVTFRWSSVSGATAYEMQISAGSDFQKAARFPGDENGSQPQHTFYGFAVGYPLQSYYWHARAKTTSGSGRRAKAKWGPWSEAATFALVPGPPNNPPTIQSVSASPAVFGSYGGSATITATIVDPEGDPVSAQSRIAKEGGGFSTNVALSCQGSSVYSGTFTAPENKASTYDIYNISVTATDGVRASNRPASASAGQIVVYPSGVVPPPPPPPPIQ